MILDLISSIIDSESSVDWGSIFICEPIVGGTNEIETMYESQESINTNTDNDGGYSFNQILI